jgi:hypothetical protein
MNVTLENNSVLLQTVQAEHAALQVVHVRQQVVLAQGQTERQERQEASDAFELEVAHLREINEALFLETTSLKLERNARKKKNPMQNEACCVPFSGGKTRLTLQCCVAL